ncbi:MAG: glycosyltransferase family 9 protein [Bdellovibrio sp.]
MKILIVQLARLGDIYMTWPALRAIRRTYPDAEIHFLTRPRFESAVEGLTSVDRHLTLSTGSVLAPLVQKECDTKKSLSVLNSIVDGLKSEKYDWIINFTFSPASSYLVHAISHTNTRVTGYTRHGDGTLKLAGETSSYFYAQVGIGKANRVHLSDIFVSMLDIEYVESDWTSPENTTCNNSLPERYIVLHVGASERQKSLSPNSWAQTLNYLFQHNSLKTTVVLIGGPEEKPLANEIIKKAPQIQFINTVGQTKMPELFSILKKAELLIGCDSAPIHMASLTDTPTFNVSVGDVNFWETGPKASLSFIYRVQDETKLSPPRLGEVLKMLLEGHVASELIIRGAGVTSYRLDEKPMQSFKWDLVKAIYLGGAYPMAERMEILQAAHQMNEINEFAMEQISLIPTKGLQLTGELLNRAEEVLHSISHCVPELSPLIDWYQAEKIAIGPGTVEEICTATLNVHQRFARHLRAYIPQEVFEEKESHG